MADDHGQVPTGGTPSPRSRSSDRIMSALALSGEEAR
jgi:hypothetical protein